MNKHDKRERKKKKTEGNENLRINLINYGNMFVHQQTKLRWIIHIKNETCTTTLWKTMFFVLIGKEVIIHENLVLS